MQTVLLTELKPEKIDRLRAWAQQLMGTRKAEAEASLRTEKIQRETAFLAYIEGKPYIIHLTESEGETLPADLSMPVNVEHQQVNRETMKPETRKTAELLYDISVAD